MHFENNNSAATEDICLSCGLCCNGVIFRDVKLQDGDDAARLELLGMKLAAPVKGDGPGQSSSVRTRAGFQFQSFSQPCVALEGCRCRIYPERPKHCREFECRLLQSLRSGSILKPEALSLIQTARQRANDVWRLLRQLGDQDEHLALAMRFRRTARRLEAADCGAETASLYGQLTLAVHELNLLLSQSFYP